jgi:hypothetical protein
MNKALQIEDQTDSYLFPEITHPHKRAFLVGIAELGRITTAAKFAGVSRRIHYCWLADDPEYVIAFEKAKKYRGDTIEDALYHRGVEGIDRPLTYEGQLTGDVVKEYSDPCLILLAKGERPEKYRDSYEGLPNGSRVQVQIINYHANNDSAQLHAQGVPAAVLEGNGKRDQAGGEGVAEKKREGQNGLKFHNFSDVPGK